MKISKVTVGVLMCLASLILLSRNLIFFGLPLFIAGFLVMNGWKRPRK
jgi:hypothetical protein